MPASIYKETTHKQKRKFSQYELTLIEDLSGFGLTPRVIGPRFGYTGQSFEKMVQTNETLRFAVEKGVSERHGEAAKLLYYRAFLEPHYAYDERGQVIKDDAGEPIVMSIGDKILMMFYAKTQMGWREKEPSVAVNISNKKEELDVSLPQEVIDGEAQELLQSFRGQLEDHTRTA